jgi:hypothetical protein
VVAGLFCVLLMGVFLGMGSTVLAVVHGPAPATTATTNTHADTRALTLPIVALVARRHGCWALWLPAPLLALIEAAATLAWRRPR